MVGACGNNGGMKMHTKYGSEDNIRTDLTESDLARDRAQ
jgi:hypothetical protein